MKRSKLQKILMSQVKSQLISFILYKPLQVTLSRNTWLFKGGKSTKNKTYTYQLHVTVDCGMCWMFFMKIFCLQLAMFKRLCLGRDVLCCLSWCKVSLWFFWMYDHCYEWRNEEWRKMPALFVISKNAFEMPKIVFKSLVVSFIYQQLI